MTVCIVAATAAMFCYQGGRGRENDGGTIGGNVCVEENTEGKMDPERGELESSSSAGKGLKVPGQQFLSNWEMEQTTVDGCSLVDGISDSEANIFPLAELVIGTQTDSQLQHCLPHQKSFIKR